MNSTNKSMTGFGEEVDDEYTWTSGPLSSSTTFNNNSINPLHTHLRDMEALLRCPICHDFLNIPVSLPPCHHSFCSECIRTSLKACMKTKRCAECPVCRNKCAGDGESKLVPNISMGQMVRQFQTLKPGLKAALTAAVTASEKKSESKHTGNSIGVSSSIDIEGGVSPRRKSSRTRKKSPRRKVAEDDSDSDDCDSDYAEELSSPKSATNSQKATVNASNIRMNRGSNAAKVTKEGTRPLRRTAVRYYGLKKKKLVELCQKEGLSTLGNEATLIQRHTEFCLLVSAECDAEHPRFEEELRKELSKREAHKNVSATLLLHQSITVHDHDVQHLYFSLYDSRWF
jgi:hypothetical protein